MGFKFGSALKKVTEAFSDDAAKKVLKESAEKYGDDIVNSGRGKPSKLSRAMIKAKMEDAGNAAVKDEMDLLIEEGVKKGSTEWEARLATARRAGAVKGRVAAKKEILNETNARAFGEKPSEGFFDKAVSLDPLTKEIASKSDFSQQASRGIAGSIHGAVAGAVIGGGINAVDGDSDTSVLEGALGGAIVGGAAGFGYGYLTQSKNLEVAQAIAGHGVNDQSVQSKLAAVRNIVKGVENMDNYADDAVEKSIARHRGIKNNNVWLKDTDEAGQLAFSNTGARSNASLGKETRSIVDVENEAARTASSVPEFGYDNIDGQISFDTYMARQQVEANALNAAKKKREIKAARAVMR